MKKEAVKNQKKEIKLAVNIKSNPGKQVNSKKASAAGMYFYKQDTAIEKLIVSTALPLEDYDVNTAWLLYQNQELCVFGPNNMRAGIILP